VIPIRTNPIAARPSPRAATSSTIGTPSGAIAMLEANRAVKEIPAVLSGWLSELRATGPTVS